MAQFGLRHALPFPLIPNHVPESFQIHHRAESLTPHNKNVTSGALTGYWNWVNVPDMAIDTLTRKDGRKAISIVLHQELYARLAKAAEDRSTPARKVTMVDVIRELIDRGC